MREIFGKTYNRPNDGELKERLSDLQYYVMVENGTERPFSNENWDKTQEGIYVDAATGQPLFTSYEKFHSNCGWPSFSAPMDAEAVVWKDDNSHGMNRTEVRSAGADLHLGHVFEDGPAESGGLRYCINGNAIRFVPLESMEAEGYGGLLDEMKKRREAAQK